MKLTPPQIVWEAHGSPAVDGCMVTEGRCFVCCGEMRIGMPVRKWMGSGFTDHARVKNPGGSHVCEACCFVTSRVTPVLGRPPGKCSACDGTLFVKTVPKAGKASRSKKGDPCPVCNGTGMNKNGGSFRNYSHLWEDGWIAPLFGSASGKVAYANASKGEKPLIRSFIERNHEGPWFAAIADSGQRHVLPFARLNGSGCAGLVLFDDIEVRVPSDTSLISQMTELLTAGASKSEITTGSYGYSWRVCEELIRQFEEQNKTLRGTAWFALCIWLAQRNEAVVQARLEREKEAKKKHGKGSGKRAARRDSDVSDRVKQSIHADTGSQPDQTLGEVSVRAPGKPDRGSNNGTVARKDPGSAQDNKPTEQRKQLSLFGDGGAG